MNEIKVTLYASENDDYVELWRTFDEEPKYYGRYTYNDEGIWYYVADPLGYCELDHQVSKSITFICCDADGNEQCRYSNGEPNPLVKFETYVKAKWNEYQKKMFVSSNTENFERNFWAMCWDATHTLKIDRWLLSFKDPELYGDKAKDYDENWVNCWHYHEINYEPLPMSGFTYLGNRFQFVKVTHKHDECGVEWFEFVCASDPMVITDTNWNPVDDWSDAKEKRYWIQSHMYLGNWFDASIKGTMYDKLTAREVMTKALKAIYESKKISKIYNSYGYVYERFVGYEEAADMLMKGDYNIKHISELIKAEADNHTFELVDDPTIEERYPNVERDHSYNYDCFGRRYA